MQIHVHVPHDGAFSLKIYNSAGELVKKLDGDTMTNAPYDHTYEWDANNDKGAPVASGVYLIYFTNKYGAQEAKLLIVR